MGMYCKKSFFLHFHSKISSTKNREGRIHGYIVFQGKYITLDEGTTQRDAR